MICSSVNLVLRMMNTPRLLYYGRTLIITAPHFGEEVSPTFADRSPNLPLCITPEFSRPPTNWKHLPTHHSRLMRAKLRRVS